MTRGRSRFLRSGHLAQRVEDLIDPEDRDLPAVELEGRGAQGLVPVGARADRDEARPPGPVERVDEPGRALVVGVVVRLAHDIDTGTPPCRESIRVASD